MVETTKVVRKSRKPHGKTYTTRRRCPFCGMIVNDSSRFGWEHVFQTFEVTYGGRTHISYKIISDGEYEEIMRRQIQRLAPRLGLRVAPA